MEILIISNSSLIIRYLKKYNQFEKVSILYFSNKNLVLQDSILKKISSINVSSSKKEFSEILRSFKNDTRCISFGSSYIFNNFNINHFKLLSNKELLSMSKNCTKLSISNGFDNVNKLLSL